MNEHCLLEYHNSISDFEEKNYCRNLECTKMPQYTRRVIKEEVKKESDFDPDYFYRASVYYYLTVLIGFSLFGILCFNLNDNFFLHLGSVGKRLLYLNQMHGTNMKIVFIFAIILHICEAVYAFVIAQEISLSSSSTKKWIFQTLILGYSSLRYLIEYRNKLEKKKQKWEK